MSAPRLASTIGDTCAACGKHNTWTMPQPAKVVEVLRCRYCRQTNHIITGER